jgi:hypothetical protein
VDIIELQETNEQTIHNPFRVLRCLLSPRRTGVINHLTHRIIVAKIVKALNRRLFSLTDDSRKALCRNQLTTHRSEVIFNDHRLTCDRNKFL